MKPGGGSPVGGALAAGTASTSHDRRTALARDDAARRDATAPGPLVEILYFDGCPNHDPAVALVERVAKELGIEPHVRLVDVPDDETARAVRFLGSPTIRVAGRDVDPSTAGRSDYGLTCRVFRTDAGIVGQPAEEWVREALLREVDERTRRPDMVAGARPRADSVVPDRRSGSSVPAAFRGL